MLKNMQINNISYDPQQDIIQSSVILSNIQGWFLIWSMTEKPNPKSVTGSEGILRSHLLYLYLLFVFFILGLRFCILTRQPIKLMASHDDIYNRMIVWLVGWLVGWILWHINYFRLFKAKSIFIQMNSSISNNSA